MSNAINFIGTIIIGIAAYYLGTLDGYRDGVEDATLVENLSDAES